jgi:hypothetical protein
MDKLFGPMLDGISEQVKEKLDPLEINLFRIEE